MKVHELIAHLKSFPSDYDVHLDFEVSEVEGDRQVRHVGSLRYQQGYKAVAIDAKSYEDTTKQGFD